MKIYFGNMSLFNIIKWNNLVLDFNLDDLKKF